MRGLFGLRSYQIPPGIFMPTLGGLGASAPIPISLRIDNPVQTVGREGHFYITNAPPNAKIYWSSFRNGQFTGEENAYYGDDTQSNGSADLPWTPRPQDEGTWVKTVLLIDGDNRYQAQVQFQVVANPTELPDPSSTFLPTYTGYSSGGYGGSSTLPGVSQRAASSGAGAAGSFLQGSFNIAGVQIPKIAVYGGAAFLALNLFKRRR